ncbi:hypothetical protein O6H91_02G011100 [Diphasiastrum complanatum]|uniref:Uncharacterized protein n=1 Tax=Diphasiastrum complanatum TaxID=34168 RepID=A0ACC2ECS0_DIPCM|nr:hypothetical protein O6H91_02G011100 [Diphasiastrum complanatum]
MRKSSWVQDLVQTSAKPFHSYAFHVSRAAVLKSKRLDPNWSNMLNHLLAFLVLMLLSYLVIWPIYSYGSSSSIFPSKLSQQAEKMGPNSGHSEEILRVYVADLPRELNYGLLESYWTERKGRKTPMQGEEETSSARSLTGDLLPYPENPLWRQYSAEYWLLADLMTPEELRRNSVAKRVRDPAQADVIFVPFFATLSAEIQLGKARGRFRHQSGNEDYSRQRKAVDIVKNSSRWSSSEGRDHVFVLTDPVAMWHVRKEIASSMFLVVDFGGWYMEDAMKISKDGGTVDVIEHTQVSLTKDVIVPYTHLLPSLHILKNSTRDTLLYFKGAKHRHRTGLVREKLWDVLQGEPGVILEEGFPSKEGRNQAMKSMRTSEFCLHPAGDTPSSCRLFDAIASLCIPVIVSDSIELPFEGMLDYRQFCIFISVQEALQPKHLIQLLQNLSSEQKRQMRQHLADVQHHFEYENMFPGGRGLVIKDGAVSLIWKKILQKVPHKQEAISRSKRIPKGASSIPARCHCV